MRVPLRLAFWPRRRLPVVLQTEAAECGLACLAMVAGFWGMTLDLLSLRRRFPVSLKGVTLKGLLAMAAGLGFQARPLTLEMAGLPFLKLPCVLHWNMNDFVVLKAVGRGQARIHDPAVGERRLSLAAVSRQFTGVALELAPGSAFRKVEAKRSFTLRSLMGRIEGLGCGLGQMLLLGLALQVCALVLPFYLQWVVDEVLVSSDRDLLTVLGSGFLLLVLLLLRNGPWVLLLSAFPMFRHN